MSDRQEIEQAIGALEAQRSILGDAATDAALDGLRQRLAELTGESKQGSIPAPETQGERRIVTVLFCDVTGSTALAESMDPEAWTEIMNAIFEHLIEPVERFGGTIARLMGDAILAFFGAPIAHEDDPQRAVLAGVAIIEEIQPFREQLQREKGLSFDVRVGINTGLVVVGEVGSQTAGEYTAMGDAVNLAARMEQTAAPGTVQVSEETYRYVAPLFEWQELGQTYSAVGQQVKVETPGDQNPWCALFGSLHFPSSEGLYTIHQRKRNLEVKAHLQQLLAMNPDTFYFVILDNASAHTTPELAPFWEAHQDRIEPVFLPTYSPHLNLIERLWNYMRGQMTRNQFYESLKVQCREIADWLATLPFPRFCSLMGIDEAALQFS